MKIYLARHGQSEWQVAPSDDWDTPLTSLGHEQARRFGEWLAEQRHLDVAMRVEVASLCTSPSKRAKETAGYAAEALGLPLVTEPLLREADFGVSECLPMAATPLDAIDAVALPDAYAAFKAQARAALRWLVRQAEECNGPVLAVTHGGLVKTLLRLLGGSDSISFRLSNTGVTLLEWRRGRWYLVYLNRWDHLPPGSRTF